MRAETGWVGGDVREEVEAGRVVRGEGAGQGRNRGSVAGLLEVAGGVT